MQSGTPRDARIFGKMDTINIITITHSCSIKAVGTPYGNTIYSTGFHCARFQYHASGREEYTPATRTFPTESCVLKRLEYSRVRTYVHRQLKLDVYIAKLPCGKRCFRLGLTAGRKSHCWMTGILDAHEYIAFGYEVYYVIHSLPLEVWSVTLISDFRNCGRMGLISVTNEFHLIFIYTLECV